MSTVVNACDAGREGELIFRLVYEMAGCHKPILRLWISSMEDTAIREGFSDLRPGAEYEALYQSALCRQKADWLVGINATRLFSVLYHRTLNVGRVQTPTLAMLAERDAKIGGFQKEKYHHVRLKVDGAEAVSEKITDPAEAEQVKAACAGAPVICTAVSREQKKEQPPKLYDLTTLQREANRMFGYETVTASFECGGHSFTAKGKHVLSEGWREIDRIFRSFLKEKEADEDRGGDLPDFFEGQTFENVEAAVTEHFTSPPKPFTEDTLLAAMERAGAEDIEAAPYYAERIARISDEGGI